MIGDGSLWVILEIRRFIGFGDFLFEELKNFGCNFVRVNESNEESDWNLGAKMSRDWEDALPLSPSVYSICWKRETTQKICYYIFFCC